MITSDDIIATLKARVEQRRQEGKYPVGMEEQLEAEFKAIMDVVHRGDDVLGSVETLLVQCKQELEILTSPVSSKSRIPGLGIVHWLIGKLVGRQTSALTARTRAALEDQQQVLELLLRQLKIQQGTDVRVLNQLSHAMLDRIMMIDVLAQSVVELEQKIASGQ